MWGGRGLSNSDTDSREDRGSVTVNDTNCSDSRHNLGQTFCVTDSLPRFTFKFRTLLVHNRERYQYSSNV